ncbi:MAG TPA: SirB2 family protein [Pseudomonadales bacterium]
MSATYMALKHTHMLCAVISIAFFALRGIWAFQGSSLLQKPWVRISPHIIDTVFLASAIGLVIVLQQYPFVSLWVTVKLLGLAGYIVLGFLTLKKAANNGQRAVFFVLALLLYGYIAGVARSKDALFFL